MSNSVGAVIVTYKGDSTLEEALRSVISQADMVCVIDNNTQPSRMHLVTKISQMYKNHCIVSQLHKNVGLGRAYNLGVDYLRKLGCTWFLLMDDDSVLDTGYVSHMLKAANDLPPAILGGNYSYADSGIQKKYEIFSRVSFSKRSNFEDGLLKVGFAISSGCLLNEKTYDLVGPFAEEFFIDYIDIEYCLRAYKKGIPTYIVQKARFSHHHGKPQNGCFFGIPIVTKNYNPLRNYYRMRNRVYCWKRYGSQCGFLVWDLLSFCLEIFKILAVENAKIQKLESIVRGIFHGIKG